MATLGELKARVLDELNRPDLAVQVAAAIPRAIEHFAARRFHFNIGRKTAVTAPGQADVPSPAGLRLPDRVFVTVGGNGYELRARSPDEIEDDLLAVSTSGQPTDYADIGATFRLYPTPDAAYTLTFVGVVDVPALVGDGTSNAWTIQAEDLIAARVRYTVGRDVLRDELIARAGAIAEGEALGRLRSEATRRGSTTIRPFP